VAAFSFGPRAPESGADVSFASLAAAGAETVSWDFGDPGSGAANSSTLSTPSHAFSSPGTYTVTLTAANAAGASVRTRTIVVADPIPARVRHAPRRRARARLDRHDLRHRRRRLELLRVGRFGAPRLHARGGGEASTVDLPLAAARRATLADVVQSEFGITNALGSLRLEADGAAASGLRLAGRTYVSTEGGTLGLGAAGLGASDGGAGDRFLANLASTTGYRTNIGAVNRSAAAVSFNVELSDSRGNLLGRNVVSLDAGAQRQWGLTELFPSATGRGLTARISPAGTAPRRSPTPRSPTTPRATRRTTRGLRGRAGRVRARNRGGSPGSRGAFFSSELSIANCTGQPMT
jgi:PKD repeat protein